MGFPRVVAVSPACGACTGLYGAQEHFRIVDVTDVCPNGREATFLCRPS